MGGLVRCDGCGGLLWSPLHSAGAPPLCDICGEPLKPERRRPGRKFGARVRRERRDLSVPAEPGGRPARQIAEI